MEEEVLQEAGRLLFHEDVPGCAEEEEDESPADPVVAREQREAAVGAGVEEDRETEEDERDGALDEHAEAEEGEDGARDPFLRFLVEDTLQQQRAAHAEGEEKVGHAEAGRRVEGDGRGADEDGHARGGGIPQPPQDEEEEAQQPQRGEEGGEAHGDLPSSEDGTEGAAQLEEEGRLAVEALEDAVVDEARNEEVARFRHVRADGRVASLGRVEDGRDDHHGKPDDGQRDKQQNKTFQGVFHAT